MGQPPHPELVWSRLDSVGLPVRPLPSGCDSTFICDVAHGQAANHGQLQLPDCHCHLHCHLDQVFDCSEHLELEVSSGAAHEPTQQEGLGEGLGEEVVG